MKESNSVPPNRLELLKHSDWARGLAHALVRDHAVADDIAQDALVLALERPAQVDPKSWLAGAVRNLVAQRRRKEARRGRREREASKVERVQDHTTMLGEVEAQSRLADHVMALDERNRDVLLWRYFRGETPRAIAAREGRSVAAVSHQLTRAHGALRQRLEANGGQSAWLGALAPLLGDKTGKLKAATATTSSVGIGSLAPLMLMGGKGILVVGLLGCAWFGLRGSLVPNTVPSALAMGASEDELEPYGGRVVSAEPSEIADITASRAALGVPMETTAPRQSVVGTVRLGAELLAGDGSPVSDATLVLTGGNGVSLASATDESGHVHWDNAPTGVALEVDMELNGQRWPDPIARLRLEPGQDCEVSWTVHLKSAIRGVAVDEEGAPLAGLLLHLLEGKEAEPRLSTLYSEDDWFGGVITDEDGGFVLPPQLAGRYRLFPCRTGSDWSEHTLRADGSVHSVEGDEWYSSRQVVAPYEVVFDVPFNVPIADVTATFYAGGKIRGQIVTASGGSAIAGVAIVVVNRVGTNQWLDVTSDASGAFTTLPLPPGPYELAAFRGPDGWCPGEPLAVESGATEVELPLVEAAAVQIRVEFAAGVEPVAGTLVIAPPADGLEFHHRRRHALSIDQSVVDETTLTPGEYGVFFLSENGTCAGSLAPMDLGTGRFPGGLVVSVVPAAEIVLKNTSEDTVARLSYCIHGMQYDVESIDPGEEEGVFGPPGATTLVTTGDGRKGKKIISLEAISGQTTVVDWE